MTYSYYSNYGNNNQNKAYGFGNNAPKQQETAGGWSKGTAKGLDTLQSGGWGKKTQPTGVFSTSTFGTGSGFSANKTAFGTNKTFGSGGSSFGSKGFGTGYGLNKPAAKRNPVPISTLGLRFTNMKKEERNNANQRKEYTVYHINMIEMFSQYTSDELRIYDYVSNDQIKPIDDTTQPTSQSKTTGFSLGGSVTAKKEEKVVNHNVQWYQVFIDKWPEIKGPDKAVQNKKQYLDLPSPKFEVAADKKKEEEELMPNTRVKLKGFKTSSTTFQNHLDNISSEQDLTLIDPSFKEEDFKFRLQFSLTPTTQRASTLQGTNTRKVTSGASRVGFSRTISEIADQDDDKSNSSGLTFIPDIKNKTDVSNLNILKDGVKLIFPSKVDVTKLDPDNNVKIEFDTKDQTNKIKDEKGNEKTFVSTISIIKISIDEKVIKKEKKDEKNSDDRIDVSTPSIIFYSFKNSNHYFVRTANKNRDMQRVGSIVNEYISDLNSYPVEIYYEKERKQTDSSNK